MSDSWPSQDAVLLAAVRSSRRTRSLRSVIEEFDALNHGIPNEADLLASTRRLVAAGLLALDGERFKLTREGRDLIRSTTKWYPQDQVEVLHRALAALPIPGPDESELPAGAYAHAVSEYQKL